MVQNSTAQNWASNLKCKEPQRKATTNWAFWICKTILSFGSFVLVQCRFKQFGRNWACFSLDTVTLSQCVSSHIVPDVNNTRTFVTLQLNKSQTTHACHYDTFNMELMQCTGHLSRSTFPGSRPRPLLKGLIKIHIFFFFPPDHVKDLRNRCTWSCCCWGSHLSNCKKKKKWGGKGGLGLNSISSKALSRHVSLFFLTYATVMTFFHVGFDMDHSCQRLPKPPMDSETSASTEI